MTPLCPNLTCHDVILFSVMYKIIDDNYEPPKLLTKACLYYKEWCMSVMVLCVEDLVMGSDAAGEKVKDHVKQLAPLLQDKSISAKDKIRLILLYIIQKGGESVAVVVCLCVVAKCLSHVCLSEHA